MDKRPARRQRPPVRSATVLGITDASPRVRCIRIGGPDLIGIDWVAGEKIKIKVADWMRSYTPSDVNSEEGWMDVVFFLHGNGSASQWAAGAAVGEALQFVGPSKSIPGPEGVPDWALFLGDETTIGLAAALLGALPETVEAIGAIEVDDVDLGALGALGVSLDAVVRQGAHGDALLDWLDGRSLPEGSGMIWVSGEAISAKALRQALMDRNPDNVQFKLKAYWSCKGHAHRKALEKEQAQAQA